MYRKLIFSVALLATSVSISCADIVTQWNFNSNPTDANTSTGSTAPSTGIGVASLLTVTGSFASGTANGGSSDPEVGDDSAWGTTGYAAISAEDKQRGVQFLVSTVGYDSITINYDLRHSNTSSRFEQLQYTLDGTTWINSTLFDGNAGDTWFNNRSADLSSITGASNNANFGIRIVSAFDPAGTGYVASTSTSTYATTGTWRFDMVTVNGIAAIPEPSSLAVLSAVGFLGLFRRRK